jgi:hypothetical protein
MYSLLSLIRESQPRAGMGAAVLTMGFCVIPILRMVAYVSGHLSPISLLGRLRIGRLIVPGYDVCFLGPLLCYLTGGAVLWMCHAFRVPMELAQPVAMTVLILVAFFAPPGLREWKLTGKHRIWPGSMIRSQQNRFVELG